MLQQETRKLNSVMQLSENCWDFNCKIFCHKDLNLYTNLFREAEDTSAHQVTAVMHNDKANTAEEDLDPKCLHKAPGKGRGVYVERNYYWRKREDR